MLCKELYNIRMITFTGITSNLITKALFFLLDTVRPKMADINVPKFEFSFESSDFTIGIKSISCFP